ncbi:MAG: hypothetical protein NC043_02630 [Muribaculaceae bacterium]|nr:hypothetical protein [Muribaculaceae bacterium]
MNTKITALIISMLMGGVTFASAHSYDDDDIYYNPSKATKTKAKEKKTYTQRANGVILYPVQDYPAADTYTVPATASSNRSVDEYNRRGIFATGAKPDATDSTSTDAFVNTRRIERFYNPDIVVSSADDELVQYYYAEPANVNIIVNAPDYWGYPYYGSAWAWGNPWYWNSWGPSWSWSWGWNNPWYWNSWGPSWSWSWGWGPAWAWGPSWGPAWSWGWGPAWTPSRRPGAVGHVRPAYTGGRPGGTAAGYRPGRGYNNTVTGNNGYRQGRGNIRGAQDSNRYSPTTRPGYNTNQNSNQNNNNNGYRPGNTRGNSSWGTGTSGGSRGGFGGGGGTRGGGGGGRGRH